MAFKWYTAPDGSVHGEHNASSVTFQIEAPARRGAKTVGEFFSYDSPTYRNFVPHDEFHGTVKSIKKRAEAEMKKAEEEEASAPVRPSRSKSSGVGKALFWGSVATLGGLAAWNWRSSK